MSLTLHVWVRSPTPGTYTGIALVQLPGVTARALQFTLCGDDARRRTFELRRRKYFCLRGATASIAPLPVLPGGSPSAQLIGVILTNLDRVVDRLRTSGLESRGFHTEYHISHLHIDAPLLDRLFGPRPVPQPRDG